MSYSMQRIEEMAEEIISGLFADGRTPMEQFGINWKQVERLERNAPQIVMGYEPDEDCLQHVR
ncbi:hypothetical protein [Photorhabdus heterorhabditis]|uniref:Uncharacterized protein n=1 Tax=Photorhabdus heterorhabditis TaxID=880156 RepID=A0A5B0WGT1_9GAMM|nr:hypothetical protein [Photorhabdus heterorhabditis]KAA1185435.1 hypothetical protein F0L16_14855 [Photorhabdus heterorhabditis]